MLNDLAWIHEPEVLEQLGKEDGGDTKDGLVTQHGVVLGSFPRDGKARASL